VGHEAPTNEATHEIIIVEGTPDGYSERGRAQVIGGKCWTAPVLANGRIYCRNAAGDLVCVSTGASEARQ
jgi:outer membrane protein assembly factor BamB